MKDIDSRDIRNKWGKPYHCLHLLLWKSLWAVLQWRGVGFQVEWIQGEWSSPVRPWKSIYQQTIMNYYCCFIICSRVASINKKQKYFNRRNKPASISNVIIYIEKTTESL